MTPLSPWQAWWDIMPWDTMSDFREQVFNGFGVVHKFKKRAAARSPRNNPQLAVAQMQQGADQLAAAVAAAASGAGAGGAGGATPAAGLA
jgi:hypothetical protein